MSAKKSSGIGQGPAKGKGNGNSRPPFNSEAGSAAGKKSSFIKDKMRKFSEEFPRSRVTEKAASRVEIAELARTKMAGGVERMAEIVQTSRSDSSAVLAQSELRVTAYGRDPQIIDVKFAFENLTDEELKAAIEREFAGLTIENEAE